MQCVNNEGADTILQGFTITGGDADSIYPHNLGGGMRNTSSSPTISDCVFSGNTADSFGGGMHNLNSNQVVANCMFSGNTASGGGGMSNNSNSLTITNCTFISNTASDFGGGGIFTLAVSV